MAVFAPTPSASVNTATAVNPGRFKSVRTPNLKSLSSVLMSSLRSSVWSLESGVKTAGLSNSVFFPAQDSRLQTPDFLFVSESDHRVHLRRAARGDEAGDERRAAEQQ